MKLRLGMARCDRHRHRHTTVLAPMMLLLVREVFGALKFLTSSDNIYMGGMPYTSILELEIAVQGDWSILIQACHEGHEYQEIYRHTAQGPIPVWPFALEWQVYADIHMNVTLYDLSSGVGYMQYKTFKVVFIEPASYVTSDPELGQDLQTLDTEDETLGELLSWATDELSNSYVRLCVHVYIYDKTAV